MNQDRKEMAARARALMQAGQTDEAELIFQQIVQEYPKMVAGLTGLAFVSMRRRDWKTALARWDVVLEQFPDKDQTGWRSGRANALMQFGRHTEAAAAFSFVLEGDPTDAKAQRGLFHALIASGQHEAALAELETGLFLGVESPFLLLQHAFLLAGRHRYAEARAEFQKAVLGVQDPVDFSHLIMLLPRLYANEAKSPQHAALLNRLDIAIAGPLPDPTHAYNALRLRLLLSTGDDAAFLASIDRIDPEEWRRAPHGDTLLHVAATLRNPSAIRKIFVIGLSKTGTTSMAEALTILGWSTADWSNPLTGDLLSLDSARYFEALSDTPISGEFERFAEAYPTAQFIYTVRPSTEWQESFIRHHHLVAGWPDFQTMRTQTEFGVREEFGGQSAALAHALFTQYDSLQEAYAAHDTRVRRYFANQPGRLLEFNVSAGDEWSKLSAFLGKPIPASPFPRKNLSPEALRANA